MKAEPSGDLCDWVRYNQSVTYASVNSLLSVPRKHGHNVLPKDVRTLLKPPESISNIVEIYPGQYKHFGIRVESITRYFHTDKFLRTIEIDINIDVYASMR